ncbi:MAG: LON peptidase substrate-binding domain-containing protein [Burkholderiaceae bacterium]
MSNEQPKTKLDTQPIALFPLGHGLFPDGLLALQLFEVRYLSMIKKVLKGDLSFGVVRLVQGAEVAKPGQEEVFETLGTMAEVIVHHQPQPGLIQIRCRGTERFRVQSAERDKTGLWMAEVNLLPGDEPEGIPSHLQPAANHLGRVIADLQKQGLDQTDMPILPPYRLDESGWVANRWAEILPLSPQQKQMLLAMESPLGRLATLRDWVGELFQE